MNLQISHYFFNAKLLVGKKKSFKSIYKLDLDI